MTDKQKERVKTVTRLVTLITMMEGGALVEGDNKPT